MGLQRSGLRVGGLRDVTVSGAIPDSAIHHWRMSEGAGSTTADNIGTADGTVNGPTWVSGTWVGDYALDGDGTDDYVETTTWSSFGSQLMSEWAISFTVQTTDDDSALFGVADQESGYAMEFVGGVGLFATTSGHFGIFVRDNETSGSSGTLQLVESTETVNDGEKYRIVVTGTGPAATDKQIWVNATEGTQIGRDDGDHTAVNDFERPVSFFARNLAGTNDNFAAATLDDYLVYDAALTDQEIQDDYTGQPWS